MNTFTVIHSKDFLIISFFYKFIYLFIYGCIESSLLCVGFLQLRRAGATLCCDVRPSHCGGFSCCGAQALGARASGVVAHGLSSCGSQALERRLSSCGTRAQLLHGMWDVPGPGLEPVSPALAADSQPLCHQGSPLIISYISHSLKHLANCLARRCHREVQRYLLEKCLFMVELVGPEP